MIDPEFWFDETLANLTPHARLLFIGCWHICDDNYATFPNRPSWIKAQIFPYESVNTTQLLDELEKNKFILKFEHNKNEYFFVPNFLRYQRVEKPSKPKYPQYPTSRGVVGEYYPTSRSKVSKLSEVKLNNDVTFSDENVDNLSFEEKRQNARDLAKSLKGGDTT